MESCRICFEPTAVHNIFRDEFVFDSKIHNNIKIFIVLNNFLHEKVRRM